MMNNENKMTLEFDDGAVLDFEIMGVFDVKGVDYIALYQEDEDEVYLFRYVAGEKEGEFDLEDIPEEEFEMVNNEYNAIMEQAEG